jgi:hypothetical protein
MSPANPVTNGNNHSMQQAINGLGIGDGLFFLDIDA